MFTQRVDEVISPTIYIDEFYQRMEDGEITADEALSFIADSIIEHQVDQNFDVREFFNDEATKDQIFIKVVNLEANEQKLKDVPHKVVNDLAITYHISVDVVEAGQGSIMINNQVMNMLGLDEKELHEIAINNTPKLLPPSLKSMEQVMREMFMGERIQGMESDMDDMLSILSGDDAPQMYVLTNSMSLNGASALFYPGMMEQISEKLGGKDFAVIPSSVHEQIILTPDMDDPRTAEELREMIVEVNTTQVAKDEQLSNHAYAYDHETKEILPMDKYFDEKALRKEKAKESERPRKGVEANLREGKEKSAMHITNKEVKPKEAGRE